MWHRPIPTSLVGTGVRFMRRSLCSGFLDLAKLCARWKPNRRAQWAVCLIASSLLVLAEFPCGVASAQTNEWAWMGGSSVYEQPSVYGLLGVPASGNIPGAVSSAVGWADTSGNLWLFGGGGSDSLGQLIDPNDLWEFNTLKNQWVWMGGSGCSWTAICGVFGVYGTLGTPSPGNMPGSRWGAAGWIDNKGNLWLFGGYGNPSNAPSYLCAGYGTLNDLWKFDTSTLQWTWMSGSQILSYIGGENCGQSGVYGTLGTPSPENVPGGRFRASSWTDKNGNLWLFGGEGFDGTNWNFGDLNDLWEFNTATNVWTWMGGSKSLGGCVGPDGQCGVPGKYGALGIAAADSTPGSRDSASSWTDSSGDFWLFGGRGYDARDTWGPLNDLWKFNPSINTWIWMSGADAMHCEQYFCGEWSVPGTLGVPSPESTPGGRSGAANWIDTAGNLWLLGGTVIDANGSHGMTSDLWAFNPSINQWAWMGGNPATAGCSTFTEGIVITYCGGESGMYGGLGSPKAGNLPGARTDSLSLSDKAGNFWLFGGEGFDASHYVYSTDSFLNDVWRFQPDVSVLPPSVTPAFSVPSGTYLNGGPLVISNSMTNATFYYTTNGAMPTASSTRYTDPFQVLISTTVKAIATAPGYPDSGVASATYIILPPAAMPTFSVPAGTYISVQTVTISDTTPGATIYYSTDGVTYNTYSSPITVASTRTILAYAVAAASGYGISATASATYTINLPQAATPSFSVPPGTYNSFQSVTISDTTPSASIYYTVDGTTPTTSSNLYTGAISIWTPVTLQAIAVAQNYSNSAVASAIYTVNSPPPTFTLSASPTSLVVSSIARGTATVTVTPQNGFSSWVVFACSGLPAGAGCSFSPASLTPSVGIAATTQLTILMVAQASNAMPITKHNRRPMPPGTTLALASVLLLLWRRRSFRTALLVVVLATGLGAISGCGGGSSGGGGSTQKVSTISVTATSGSIQQTATISLTLN